MDLLGGLTPETVTNITVTRLTKSLEYHQRYYQKTRSWYDLFRCIYTGTQPNFKNVVMLPLVLSAVWSDVANKCAISLDDHRIIEIDPIDPTQGPSARRTEALLNQQFLDMKILEKMIDFLLCADLYGTGLLQYGWRNETVPYTYRQNIFGVERRVSKLVTLFDGPDIEVVDPLDFMPQPGKKTIDTMAYACRRYWKDLDDIEEENWIAINKGEDPIFDPQQVALLKNMPPSQPVINEMNERNQVWRSWSQYQAIRQEKYAKPVELVDMVGLVPSDYAPDGVRLRVMTVANRQVAMRNIALPNWSLKKYFRSYCPMQDPHFFHGIGKVEPIATLANTANKLVSNRLDVLDLVLQPAMFVSDRTGLDTQNMVLWPGRVIKIEGDTGEAQIRPVEFDLQAYPIVVNELEAISRYIDMGTGVQRDTIQGMLSGDRQTAREFLGRMEQARTRLGLEAKLFERAVIEPLAEDIRMLNRQYLTMPKQVALIGSLAVTDPDTGQQIPQEIGMANVDLNDINADHKIRGVGASNMLTKSMKRQDYITAMQALSANPVALQRTNWVTVLNKFWRAFDESPTEMVLSDQAMQGGVNMMPGMAPQGVGGAPGSDMLEQLGGGMFGQQGPAPAGLMSVMGAGAQQNIGQ